MAITIPFFSPIIDIYLYSFIGSIILVLLEKFFFKTRPTKDEKKYLKKIRGDMRKYLKNKETKKAQDAQKELASYQLKQMGKSFSPKVLLFRMLPYSFFLGFIRMNYKVLGVILNFSFIHFSWLGTYIFFSIINSIIFNKLFEKFIEK